MSVQGVRENPVGRKAMRTLLDISGAGRIKSGAAALLVLPATSARAGIVAADLLSGDFNGGRRSRRAERSLRKPGLRPCFGSAEDVATPATGRWRHPRLVYGPALSIVEACAEPGRSRPALSASKGATEIRFSRRRRRYTYEPEHLALRNPAKWGKLQPGEGPPPDVWYALTNGQRMAASAR